MYHLYNYKGNPFSEFPFKKNMPDQKKKESMKTVCVTYVHHHHHHTSMSNTQLKLRSPVVVYRVFLEAERVVVAEYHSVSRQPGRKCKELCGSALPALSMSSNCLYFSGLHTYNKHI